MSKKRTEIAKTIAERISELTQLNEQQEAEIRARNEEKKCLVRALSAVDPAAGEENKGSCTMDDVIAALNAVLGKQSGGPILTAEAYRLTVTQLESDGKSLGAGLRWKQLLSSKRNPFVLSGDSIAQGVERGGVPEAPTPPPPPVHARTSTSSTAGASHARSEREPPTSTP